MTLQFKKIKFSNDLWISFRRNKLLFGYCSFPDNIHLTLHLGDISSVFDIHLTHDMKRIHFSVVEMSHTDFYLITHALLTNTFNTIFQSSEIIDESIIRENNFKVFKINTPEIPNEEIIKLKKKKAINFDVGTKEFNQLQEYLKDNIEISKIEPKTINQYENSLVFY